MSVTTNKQASLDELLARPQVTLEPSDYSIAAIYEGYARLDYSDGYPGVILRIGESYYEIYAGEVESNINPITFGNLRNLGLLDLLDPRIEDGDMDDEDEIKFSDFRTDLQERMWEVIAAEQAKADIAAADAQTNAVIDWFADTSTPIIRHLPRGFGNEVDYIFCATLAEQRQALKHLAENSDQNARWTKVTVKDLRKDLQSYFWDLQQSDSAFHQRAGTRSFRWWEFQ